MKAGGKGDNRGWRWLKGITDSVDTNLHKLWDRLKNRCPGVLKFMGSQKVGHSLGTEQLLIAVLLTP